MWSAFDNLSNLASQAVQTAVQTTTEAVNLATDTVNQVATETLRKVSSDQDNGDAPEKSVKNENSETPEKKAVTVEKGEATNETSMPNSCPVATNQDENTSETTKELTAQADQFADGFFSFASSLADEAYKNTCDFTSQALEISNQAHAQLTQQTGTLYTQILENEMVNNVVKTVEDKTILGDFHKEQSKHIETQNDLNSQSGLPWEGYESSEVLEDKIRALSKDERNFRRNPPNGVSFTFDYKVSFPQALLVLEADEELQKMRFLLVPKKMKEEIFWRNYFYRVSLIKQSYQLQEMTGSRSSLNNLEASQEKDLPGNSIGSGLGSKTTSKNSQKPANEKPASSEDEVLEEDPNFATDDFNTDLNADELQEEMKALGMDDNVDWEKELQEELNEYEVVPENEKKGGSDHTSESWEKEVEDMLNE
jgi:hypothetical protein